jgi:hypothetical protein
MNSQKFLLFIDTDIVTYKTASSIAKYIDGGKIKDKTVNPFPGTTKEQSFLPMHQFEDRVNDILIDSEKMQFDGYALNDIGKYLYSDYSSNAYSRNQSQSEISTQIPVLATNKSIMIDTGNFYAIKNALVVSEIPVSPLAYIPSDTYVGIPFVQMLLHGIMEYSVSPLNTALDKRTAFLKAIEYGCIPSTQWYCTLYNETLDKTHFYNNNINEMVDYYTKANMALSELRDARMTSHTQIGKGVYCTEYDNSIKVYVNYTDKSVSINGILINAKDCVTIS